MARTNAALRADDDRVGGDPWARPPSYVPTPDSNLDYAYPAPPTAEPADFYVPPGDEPKAKLTPAAGAAAPWKPGSTGEPTDYYGGFNYLASGGGADGVNYAAQSLGNPDAPPRNAPEPKPPPTSSSGDPNDPNFQPGGQGYADWWAAQVDKNGVPLFLPSGANNPKSTGISAAEEAQKAYNDYLNNPTAQNYYKVTGQTPPGPFDSMAFWTRMQNAAAGGTGGGTGGSTGGTYGGSYERDWMDFINGKGAIPYQDFRNNLPKYVEEFNTKYPGANLKAVGRPGDYDTVQLPNGQIYDVHTSGGQYVWMLEGAGGAGDKPPTTATFDPNSPGLKPWDREFVAPPGEPGVLDLPDYVAPEKFVAPDASAMYADPGYKFRTNEAEDRFLSSAAAQGMLRSGGTLTDFLKYGQEVASQEYGNVYNRARDQYDVNDRRARDIYNTGVDTQKTEHADAVARWNTDYRNAWDQYINEMNAYNTAQENLWNRLHPSGIDTTAANT